MFARSKGDKARSSKNNGNEREKDDSARHVHVVAAFFFVIGLLLLFGSVYLDEHQAALQPWLGHNSLQLLEHLIESIGDALIVVAIFSIALEFRDFTEYTSRILRKLLLDREYIKNLKPEEQQRLKLEVDAEILGASDLLSKGTFYRFVGSFAEDVLKMPYRREMSDLTVFSIVEGNPDLMKRTTTTRYVFVKGLSPKEQPMSVTWSASFPKIAGALGQPKICDLSVTLFKKNRLKWVPMRILKLSSAENRFFLNEDKSTQQPPRAADSVEIEETKEIESTIEFTTYRFRYEIPESRTFEAEDEVMVEISDEELIPSADTQNFVRLSYPTRGFSLTLPFSRLY